MRNQAIDCGPSMIAVVLDYTLGKKTIQQESIGWWGGIIKIYRG